MRWGNPRPQDLRIESKAKQKSKNKLTKTGYWEKENMAYCICRISKLKSGGSITASEQHTLRQRETPNADLSQENERFISYPYTPPDTSLEKEVFARIGEQKIRKDAVLCVEILLTASPEYFRPDDHGKAGKWDADQLDQWKQSNRQWLDQKFGDRIVRAELHLDESTPHIHAYLVPLDDKGKLNCKSHFGGRVKLSQFQDSYAQAMQPIGLERGIKGSRAKHTEVKEYYAAVVKEPDQSLTPQEIHHQLADRQRIIKENIQLEQTAKAISRTNEQLQQQVQQLQSQVKTQQRETENWQQKYQATVNQLRTIPLTQVAHELGLDPDPKDKHKWRNEQHTLNITGSKFYDFKSMQGGGGAIDLVMYLEQCRFGEAVHWLKNHFGGGQTLQTITQQTIQTIQEKPQKQFIAPEPNQDHWPAIRDYLTQTRKLPEQQIQHLHDQGLIYADEHQNAVFLRRSFEGTTTGASLRGTAGKNNQFKGLAAGTRRSQGWFYIESGHEGPIQRAVLCESAIDCLSYQTLYPPEEKTIYLSTDGAGYVPTEQLQQYPKITLALDNDAAGQQMAQKLKRDLPQVKIQAPENKDWNQDLKFAVEGLTQLMQKVTVKYQRPYGQSFGISL